ncbi:hypothetical protein M2157_009670 [Streptomyces sp. SAI-127]|nr:hypothetical protein [Streptomyces sp. SAI-127]
MPLAHLDTHVSSSEEHHPGTALDKATDNPEWHAWLQRMFDDPDLHITSEPASYRGRRRTRPPGNASLGTLTPRTLPSSAACRRAGRRPTTEQASSCGPGAASRRGSRGSPGPCTRVRFARRPTFAVLAAARTAVPCTIPASGVPAHRPCTIPPSHPSSGQGQLPADELRGPDPEPGVVRADLLPVLAGHHAPLLAVLIALGVSLLGVTAGMTSACGHGTMAALAFLLRSPSDNGLSAPARGVLGVGVGSFSAAMPLGHALRPLDEWAAIRKRSICPRPRHLRHGANGFTQHNSA